MTKRGTSGPPAAVGGSSLLVIFAVLCLTVFALLTLSTAAADSRLSQDAADAVEAYYQADSQAEAGRTPSTAPRGCGSRGRCGAPRGPGSGGRPPPGR